MLPRKGPAGRRVSAARHDVLSRHPALWRGPKPTVSMEAPHKGRWLRSPQGRQEVVPMSRVRELENRVRELERLLGRKTMETEILREAL